MSDNDLRFDAVLYPIYASYKKATNAIVIWIATAASGKYLGQDGAKWTLKELRRAATTIAKSNCTDIPLRIPHAFQDAIEARKEITTFYKQHTKIDSIGIKKQENSTETYFNSLSCRSIDENDRSLGRGRSRLHSEYFRCLAYHRGSGLSAVSIQQTRIFHINERHRSWRALC